MNNEYLNENERDEEETYYTNPNQDLDNYEDIINESVTGNEEISQELSYQNDVETTSENDNHQPIDFEIEGTHYEAVLEKYDSSRNNHGKNLVNNIKNDPSTSIKKGFSRINFNLNQGSRGYAVISSLTTIVAIAGIIIFYIVTKI